MGGSAADALLRAESSAAWMCGPWSGRSRSRLNTRAQRARTRALAVAGSRRAASIGSDRWRARSPAGSRRPPAPPDPGAPCGGASGSRQAVRQRAPAASARSGWGPLSFSQIAAAAARLAVCAAHSEVTRPLTLPPAAGRGSAREPGPSRAVSGGRPRGPWVPWGSCRPAARGAGGGVALMLPMCRVAQERRALVTRCFSPPDKVTASRSSSPTSRPT